MDPEPQSDHMEDVRPDQAGIVDDNATDEELSLDEQISAEDGEELAEG